MSIVAEADVAGASDFRAETDESLIALACVSGVGDVGFRQLLKTHRSAERALATFAPEERSFALEQARAIHRSAVDAKVRIRASVDPAYPAALLDLADPPRLLYSIGDDPPTDAVYVTIVGTRNSTDYGERVAREIAAAVSRAGGVVLSGMARGIDAAAHEGALTAGGITVAVLGTGPDVAYPAAHRAMHRRIVERGQVLSEIEPGVKATPASFPRRNRILAAMARLTIVVEAGAKSGALITAAAAMSLDRTVGAVPGRIDASESAGTNELLRDGAQVIASIADALALAGLTAPVRVVRDDWPPEQRAIWNALQQGPLALDSLAARSRLPARVCMTAVTALEIAGAVECTLAGEVRRR